MVEWMVAGMVEQKADERAERKAVSKDVTMVALLVGQLVDRKDGRSAVWSASTMVGPKDRKQVVGSAISNQQIKFKHSDEKLRL